MERKIILCVFVSNSSFSLFVNSPLVWALGIRKQFLDFISGYGSFFAKFSSDTFT
ncbi:hypothetical protein C1645_816268 [Glomus cerebriforme]|uniref:Uncharacterized protein n=1 Tax=Glomus cerebriforme TaxID=658196 RepID=A0A397TD31_9GLOM|nr:hypothetical protein C1645_816268 [Glomus cerebriforme]